MALDVCRVKEMARHLLKAGMYKRHSFGLKDITPHITDADEDVTAEKVSG